MSKNDRKKLTEFEKSLIGRVCCNCGSEEDLQYHHIVPLALGGRDIISNMCCLCYDCHYKLHHNGEEGKVNNYGEAIRVGLQMAYLQGKKCFEGRKPITKKDLPKDFPKLYRQWRNKEITAVQFTKLLGLNSRTTLYKYIKIFETE